MNIIMTKNIILFAAFLSAYAHAETPIPPEMVWESGSSVYSNWNAGEPNNSGNEDCAVMLSDGRWNDASCSSTNRTACYNGTDWKVFGGLALQPFERAGRNCFDGYEFAAPVTAAQNAALKAAADSTGNPYPIWINLQDQDQEGRWVFNQRVSESPYNRGGDLGSPIWYAVVDGDNNVRSGPFPDYETGANNVTFEQAVDINTGAPNYWKVTDGGFFDPGAKPEPNNTGDCAQLYVNDGGLWDDTNCGDSKRVACFNGYKWAISATAVSFNGGSDVESMANPMQACTGITDNGEAGNYQFAAPLSVQDSLTLQTIASQAGVGSIWINLQDKKYENVWKFNKNLDVVAPFWKPGEPNNAGSGEDCAEQDTGADGFWNDVSCSQQRRVACFDPYDGVDGNWQVTTSTYAFDQDIEFYNLICQNSFGSKYKFFAPERLSQRAELNAAAGSGTVWINATDRDAEGVWKINRNLNNWADNEPVNNTDLRCVSASVDTTLWNARDCSESRPVACFSGGRWYFTETSYALNDLLEGQRACQALNPGYLFSAPKDFRQMQAIKYFAEKQGISGDVWINGNRLEDYNTWVWNELDLLIPAWGDNEPNGGKAENCATLNSSGQWADVACGSQMNQYLCRNGNQWQLSVNSGSLQDFSVASQACKSLGSGWVFAAPTTYNENLQALAVIPAGTVAWLNATDSIAENDWITNAANITGNPSWPEWQANQPDNGGILAAAETAVVKGEDCVAQYADGRWADLDCNAAIEAPWACTDGRTWKVTRSQGRVTRFDEGHRQCFYEYGSEFIFSAPLNKNDAIQLDFARLLAAKQRGSAIAFVWLNMTDGAEEDEVSAASSGETFEKNLPYSNWLNAYPGQQPVVDCAFKASVAVGQNNPWRTFNCTSEAAHYACFDGASWKVATSKGELVGGTLQITPQVGEDYWSYDRGNQLCKEQHGDNYFFAAPVTAAEDLALDAAIRSIKAQVKNTWINYYRSNRVNAAQGSWFANRLELRSWQKATFNNFNNADCSLLHPDGSITDADCNLEYGVACFNGGWVISGNDRWNRGFQICEDNENSLYAVPRTPNELAELQAQMSGQPVWINLSDTALESQWIANRLRFTWWTAAEPSNIGNRDCAKINHQTGEWYAARCSTEAARFACRTINSSGNIIWTATTSKDIWSRGFSRCQREVADSEFMAPQGYGSVSASDSQAVLAGIAAAANEDLWINLSDQGVEGNWRSFLSYSDWGVVSLLDEDRDCAYYDRKAQQGGTWYADQCTYTNSQPVSRGYACTNGYEWRLVETTVSSSLRWSDGFTACNALGADWYYAAPTNAVENAKLKLALEIAGVDQIWINAQDRIEEGNWTINGEETNFPAIIDTSATLTVVAENTSGIVLSAQMADDEGMGIASASWTLISDSRFSDVGNSDVVISNEVLTTGAAGTAQLTAQYSTPVLLQQDVILVFRINVTDIPQGTAQAATSEAFVTVRVKAPILAHYDFNDLGAPQKDISGNNHNALNNSLNPMPPVVAGALSLSGTQRMIVPGGVNGLDIPVNEYTVAFRISIEAAGNGSEARGILQKGTGASQPALLLLPGSDQLQITNTTITTTNVITDQNGVTSVLEDRQWLNVVYSKRSDGIDVYIDNILRPEASVNFAAGETSVGNNDDLFIGYVPGAPVSFTGLMDDVQIFNRLLSAAERAAILPAPPAGKLQFTLAGSEVNEDSSSVVLTVERVRGSRNPITADVVFNAASSLATLGAENTLSGVADIAFAGSGAVAVDRAAVNWPADTRGTQTVTLLLDSNDDAEREGTELAVFDLDVSATTGLEAGVPASYNLRLNDVTPNPFGNFELQLPADPLILENDSVARAVCIVRKSGGDGAVTVGYSIGGSAQPGIDYEFVNTADIVPASSSGTVIFASNPGSPYSDEQQCFEVRALNRAAIGTADRKIEFTLTSVSGEAGKDPLLSANNNGALIVRDYAPGQFEFTADAFTCKEPNTSTEVPSELRAIAEDLVCEVTVRRYNTAIYAPAADLLITASPASTADAADASFTTSLNWPALSLASPGTAATELRTIQVAVTNDDVQENDELLQLQLAAVSGEDITRALTDLTIVDVTRPALVTISSTQTSVNEGQSVIFDIARSNNINTAFSFDYVVDVQGKAVGKTNADYIDFASGSAETGTISFSGGESNAAQLTLNTIDTLEPTASLNVQVTLQDPNIPRVVGMGALNNANKDSAINRTDDSVTVLNTKDRIENNYSITLSNGGDTVYGPDITPAVPSYLTTNTEHSPTRRVVNFSFTLPAKNTLDIDHKKIRYTWSITDNSWFDGVVTQTDTNSLFTDRTGNVDYGFASHDPSAPLTVSGSFVVPFVITNTNFTLELKLEGGDGSTYPETFTKQMTFTAVPLWRRLKNDGYCLRGGGLSNDCSGDGALWTWAGYNLMLINKASQISGSANKCYQQIDVTGADKISLQTCDLNNSNRQVTFTKKDGFTQLNVGGNASCGYATGTGLELFSQGSVWQCASDDRTWTWSN